MKHPHRIAANIFFVLCTLLTVLTYILYFSKSFTITEAIGLFSGCIILVILYQKYENTFANYMSPGLTGPLIIAKCLTYILLCKVTTNMLISHHAMWVFSAIVGLGFTAFDMYKSNFKTKEY